MSILLTFFLLIYCLIVIEIETVDDIQSLGTCSNNDRELFVLMKSGHLNIWDIVERKVIKVF